MSGKRDDNIILISARFGEPAPIEHVRHGWDACRHEHTMIDDRLRIVSCRDCGEQRIDPFEVLLHLSRQWERWHSEAEALRMLRAEQREHDREIWERRRDRHTNAHPDHDLQPGRKEWGHSEGSCRECYSLELRYDPRWYPTPVMEPQP